MKRNRMKKCLSVLLALLTLTEGAAGAVFAAAETETTLYSLDFEQYASKNGKQITKGDGFHTDMPSSAKAVKDGDGTCLQVDFSSSYSSDEKIWYTRSGGTFSIVPEGTEGALPMDRASFGLMSGNDLNLDKNVTVGNPELSYAKNRTIVLEAEYYLSEDAKGTIQSQFYGYKTNGEEKWWLSLFTVNAETGVISVSGQRTNVNAMKKGAWNTVSLVIDLMSGKIDTYLNHVLCASGGSLGANKLILSADKYIVAKIPRTTSDKSDVKNDLGGYFRVDNVSVYTLPSDAEKEFPRTDGKGGVFSGTKITLRGKELGVFPQTKVLNTRGIKAEAGYLSLQSYTGVFSPAEVPVSMRLGEPTGIRFTSRLNLAQLRTILSDARAADPGAYLTVGTLIAPVSYIGEAGAFTKEALDKLTHSRNYLDVRLEQKELDALLASEKADTVYAGSLVGISPSHADTAFAGVGYVALHTSYGETCVLYAEYDEEKQSAKPSVLISSLRAQGYVFTDRQEQSLSSFDLHPVTVPEGSAVLDVSYTGEAVYFRHKASGLLCRLCYAGDYGWRLQAQDSDRFSSSGAAQTLALYMNERYDIDPEPITVEDRDGKLRLTAKDGTEAVLSFEKFSIEYYSPEKALLTGIVDIKKNKVTGYVTVTGTMDKAEGVFGGGERFDTVNKNGTKMTLYTADRWNDSAGSYVSVPLFLFTGGYGVYVNRYEMLTASFAVQGAKDRWKIELQSKIADLYVYASGEMKDALTGYTKLTGSAEIPDEWNYGAVITRYGPDFNHLYTKDDVPGTTNPDKAPSGRGFQTIVEGLLNAGMPLTAVVTEGWGYSGIFDSAAKRAEWQEAIDWLHAKGIKVMLYTRVASTIPTGPLSGYREEYLVHAKVTAKGKSTLTVDIPNSGDVGSNPDAPVGAVFHYVDITNPAAMDWYLDGIWGTLVSMGFDGVKIDFCETFPDGGRNYGGTVVDYQWYDDTVFEKGTEHHAYPTLFISKFYERMNELKDAKYGGQSDGFMVLSRGGGIGSQRSPYMWGGDQTRSFDKLDDQLMCVLNSGMSGIPFMTFDMAGYRYGGEGLTYASSNGKSYESRVFARAVEFTAFMTNIQTHGTVRNAYELNDQAQEIYRRCLGIHSSLSGYFDKLSKIASETGIPPVRALALEYASDRKTYSIKDQFLLGDALLVAPILSASKNTRNVYLPAGKWLNLLTGEELTLTKGTEVSCKTNISQIPVFLNLESEDAESLRPIFDGADWTALKNAE